MTQINIVAYLFNRSRAHHWTYIAFGLLLILLGSAGSAHAQSRDRDNPTPLTSTEISGMTDAAGYSHYYTFFAGPGEVAITIDVEGREGNTVSLELFKEEIGQERSIAFTTVRASLFFSSEALEHIKLGARELVLLRVSFGNQNSGSGKYRVRLSGPVDMGIHAATITGVSSLDDLESKVLVDPTTSIADLESEVKANQNKSTSVGGLDDLESKIKSNQNNKVGLSAGLRLGTYRIVTTEIGKQAVHSPSRQGISPRVGLPTLKANVTFKIKIESISEDGAVIGVLMRSWRVGRLRGTIGDNGSLQLRGFITGGTISGTSAWEFNLTAIVEKKGMTQGKYSLVSQQAWIRGEFNLAALEDSN